MFTDFLDQGKAFRIRRVQWRCAHRLAMNHYTVKRVEFVGRHEACLLLDNHLALKTVPQFKIVTISR